MMEETQEQRYVCKFCNKRCISGKSLGGHMRGHLALISAAKKAKQKALSNIVDFEGGDHSGYALGDELPKKIGKETEQSNSCLNQEKLKNNDVELDSGEDDGYGLREHPRKSWKISDLKHPGSSKRNHCKECGKGFSSVRALAGHMRCHPLKKRENFPCKKCNKGFDSMRALFGHMKCHSKRSRVCDESAESIAEFAALCPVKKKRSTIRYRPSPNISFSSQNTSSTSSLVTEAEEIEDVAWCLLLLSRGVTKWDANNSNSMSSNNNNNSVTFEADSSDHYMGIAKIEAGDFVSGETCKIENPRQFAGNAFSEEVITSAIGGFDSSQYANGDENFGWELSLDAFLGSDRKFKKLKEDKCEFRQDDIDSTEVGLLKSLIPEVRIDDNADLDFLNFHPRKNLSSNLDPRFWWESSEEISYTATDLDIQEAEKTPEYKCKTCGKVFGSHQALGGHQNKHKLATVSSTVSTETTLQSDFGSKLKLDSPESSDDPFEAEATERIVTGFVSLKNHQCPICFKIFSSGQALGGHKRAHYGGFSSESKTRQKLNSNQEVSGIQMDLGLALAVTADGGGANVNVDSKPWWTATSPEHEALVG